MKQVWMILLIALVSSSGVPADAARPVTRVGVLMWSEDPGYYEALKGIMDQLRKEGFREPAVQFTLENARGGKAKLSEMAHRFAVAKMDLVVSLGTTATIVAAREIHDLPLVFAHVYDPVQSGIVRRFGTSGNNITGVSSRIGMAKLVNCLKEFAPVSRLAVLYTPGEKNSELQLQELQKVLAGSPVKVVPVILSREEEAVQTMSMISPAVDAIYLSGSSIVVNNVSTIVAMATKAKVITITHLDNLVHRGVLLGVCPAPYLVGRLAGEKVVKVLKGAKPSSIPVESANGSEVMLNMKTAKSGGFRPPPSFMKSVTKIIE
jgi:putative ABC transport system substrate-binding protein